MDHKSLVRNDLRECIYGRYEGLTSEEIEAQRPGWSLWRGGCPPGEDAAAAGGGGGRAPGETPGAGGDGCGGGPGPPLRGPGARLPGPPPSAGAPFGLGAAPL